jgi:hypothetical protein
VLATGLSGERAVAARPSHPTVYFVSPVFFVVCWNAEILWELSLHKICVVGHLWLKFEFL